MRLKVICSVILLAIFLQEDCVLIGNKCFLKSVISNGAVIKYRNRAFQDVFDKPAQELHSLDWVRLDEDLLGLMVKTVFPADELNRLKSNRDYLTVQYFFKKNGECVGMLFLLNKDTNIPLATLSKLEDELLNGELVNLEKSYIPEDIYGTMVTAIYIRFEQF